MAEIKNNIGFDTGGPDSTNLFQNWKNYSLFQLPNRALNGPLQTFLTLCTHNDTVNKCNTYMG